MTKSSSLSHQVVDDLRRDIIAGAFAPGSWLKTDELARRYSVSANPVREALWRLQGEGFVIANPNQGARVRFVDDDFVRNIFEIREAIEPLFLRRFCYRVTAETLDQLREAAARFAEVASQKSPEFGALDTANRAFHDVIQEGEVNLPAIEVMARYDGLIKATRSKLPISPASLRDRVNQHAEIIKAIEVGDADAAAAAAAVHIRSAAQDMLTQMRQVRTIAARVATA
jgi:DNA-binding GntR family transcriptional regulator